MLKRFLVNNFFKLKENYSKKIPEEDLKICLCVMKKEIANFHLLESAQLGNLFMGQDSMIVEKGCTSQLEVLENAFIQRNCSNFSCCRNTK